MYLTKQKMVKFVDETSKTISKHKFSEPKVYLNQETGGKHIGEKIATKKGLMVVNYETTKIDIYPIDKIIKGRHKQYELPCRLDGKQGNKVQLCSVVPEEHMQELKVRPGLWILSANGIYMPSFLIQKEIGVTDYKSDSVEPLELYEDDIKAYKTLLATNSQVVFILRTIHEELKTLAVDDPKRLLIINNRLEQAFTLIEFDDTSI